MSQTLEALVVELRADVKGLQTSLQTAASDVRRFSDAAETNVNGFQAAIGRARTAVLSLGLAYAGFRIGSSIVDAGVQVEAMRNKMVAATGDARVAGDALAYVRAEANRLGLDIRSASDGFAGFSASSLRAGLTLQQTKDIFTGVSEAAVSMRLPAEQVSLVFKALEQMAGKGTVSMEELRGQLGDALPGAFEIAAKAMGKTTAEFSKMVGNGEVLASDFLPKFGEAIKRELGGSVDEASQGAQAGFNRLGNAFFDLRAQMASAGFLDAVTQAITSLTTALNDPDTVEGMRGFATLLGNIASSAVSAASALGNFYTSANKAIEQAGDSAFSGLFGQEGANAIAGARKAKADAANEPQNTKALQQRVLADYIAKQEAITKARGGKSESSTSLRSYTLGAPAKSVTSTADSEKAAKAREQVQKAAARAQEQARAEADRTREQLGSQVQSMRYDSASPSDKAAMDVEEQQKLLKEALDAKAITEQEYRDLGLQAEMDYQQRLTDVRQQAADTEKSIRNKTLNDIVGLLQVFAGKNKAIAIALLAFDKARAIAQTIMETHVAAAAALKYDPTGATSARVTMLGYANVAAIAATGIAQLATMGTGGGGGSSGSSDGGGVSGGDGGGGSFTSAPEKTLQITLVGSEFANFSKNQVRDFIDLINDAQRDGSRVEIAYT